MSIFDPSLRAAGIIGTWDTNVLAGQSILDEGAAELLAGDAGLAGLPIPMEVALRRLHPDDCGWVFDRIRRVRQTGGSFSAEFRVVTETGKVRWVLNRGSLAPDETGAMHGRGAYIDTTDSHQDSFLPIDGVQTPESDALIVAVDRCIEAHTAITQTGHKKLKLLSDLLLFEIGRMLARRATVLPQGRRLSTLG